MLRHAFNCILTFLLLVGTVLCSVRPASAWYCEGKQCGVSLWACCCAAPSSSQDGKCRTSPSASKGDKDSLCAAGCRCAVVITSAPDCDHAPPPVTAPLESPTVLAILPTPIATYAPPLFVEVVSHRTETRGPPTNRFSHVRPSLRAPPTA